MQITMGKGLRLRTVRMRPWGDGDDPAVKHVVGPCSGAVIGDDVLKPFFSKRWPASTHHTKLT
jgi:hypothetical protein